MYTRCPDCSTVHPLNATLLAQAGGIVRCGRCNKVFSALEWLFDTWPEAGEQPPADDSESSMPPHLGVQLTTEAELDDGPAANDEDLEQDLQDLPAATPAVTDHKGWRIALIALSVLTVVNLIWVTRSSWSEQAWARSLLSKFTGEQELTDQRDVSQIRLASRDMHSHPSRAGSLILSATLINQGSYPQAFPQMEIILLDTNNRAIASRTFLPSEYLDENADLQNGLAPGVLLPVLLELQDPGIQAVGFEMHFH